VGVGVTVRRLAGRVERLLLPLTARGRLGQAAIERIEGVELYVPPTVLNPAVFHTGTLLAKTVRKMIRPGHKMLDMGSGSGLVGIVAALDGGEVCAVDLNPEAVQATSSNAARNGVSIDVRSGSLFEPFETRSSFDLVAFNPPFFERRQGGLLELALSDERGLPTLRRFLIDVREHLSPGGRVAIAGSTTGALGTISCDVSTGVRAVRSRLCALHPGGLRDSGVDEDLPAARTVDRRIRPPPSGEMDWQTQH
jgi:methylase of polypeptide subunit release factors